jgi:hypothetical protein
VFSRVEMVLLNYLPKGEKKGYIMMVTQRYLKLEVMLIAEKDEDENFFFTMQLNIWNFYFCSL